MRRGEEANVGVMEEQMPLINAAADGDVVNIRAGGGGRGRERAGC